MARIEYPDLDSVPGARTLADRVIEQRGSILHLYRMLMHSPVVAEGWLAYLTSIRQQSRLDGCLREMVIMRIAHLNRAPYEADQHRDIALAEGLTQVQLDALRTRDPDPALFTDIQHRVLAYTDAMTLTVQVPDDQFDELKQHFDAAELVELTATVAAYNMVSRFVEALGITSSDVVDGARRST